MVFNAGFAFFPRIIPQTIDFAKLVGDSGESLVEIGRRRYPQHPATGDPSKRRVVLEAPRSAPVSAIVTVLDLMRGAGIESERYGGQIPPRPR